ncbi:hypothetical protein FS837_012548 [Tulasnella sp. UAMH 9824]|nr:hypothetical protein FS837_012548 [Tulasnella sp. UAMH 9824]
MMFKLIPATLTTLILFSSVNAWGTLGHKTVANVAIQLLLPQTLTSVSSILSTDPTKTTTNPTLVDVANWADTYRYTTTGKFSADFHYVDAHDNPPTSCGVDFARDCSSAGGCIITAITNYTQRVQDGRLTVQHTAEALKFLVHFIGDVTQPLHTEALAVGGNDIDVLWNGASNNLHHVWDTEMITKLAGPDMTANLNAWTGAIVNEIRNGAYASSVSSWLSCSDITQAQVEAACSTAWATDANAFVCSYVLNPNPAGQELNGTYYNGAAPVIQMQIAKGGRLILWTPAQTKSVLLTSGIFPPLHPCIASGGVRLAVWLNKIFAGSTGF